MGKNVSVSVLDFGGQSNQYLCGQYFITASAFYLLIINSETTEADKYHFLETISHLTKSDDQKTVNVLPVINSNNDGLSYHHIEWPDDIYRTVENSQVRLLPAITANLAKDSSDRSIRYLIAMTKDYIFMQTSIKASANYSMAKEYFLSFEQAFMDIDLFSHLCKDKFGFRSKSAIDNLLNYLDSSGTILYLERSKTVILNINWFIGVAYSLLNFAGQSSLTQRYTHFHKSSIVKSDEWNYLCHDDLDRDKLFDILFVNQFDLIFRTNSSTQPDRYFIPKHFDREKNLDFLDRQLTDFSGIALTISFDYIPLSMFGRLVAKNYYVVENKGSKPSVWKNIFIVELDSTQSTPNYAYIVKRKNNLIFISPKANSDACYSARDKFYLDVTEVASSYVSLHYKTEIPCPKCSYSIESIVKFDGFSYNRIRSSIKFGADSVNHNCTKCNNIFSPIELVYGKAHSIASTTKHPTPHTLNGQLLPAQITKHIETLSPDELLIDLFRLTCIRSEHLPNDIVEKFEFTFDERESRYVTIAKNTFIEFLTGRQRTFSKGKTKGKVFSLTCYFVKYFFPDSAAHTYFSKFVIEFKKTFDTGTSTIRLAYINPPDSALREAKIILREYFISQQSLSLHTYRRGNAGRGNIGNFKR